MTNRLNSEQILNAIFSLLPSFIHSRKKGVVWSPQSAKPANNKKKPNHTQHMLQYKRTWCAQMSHTESESETGTEDATASYAIVNYTEMWVASRKAAWVRWYMCVYGMFTFPPRKTNQNNNKNQFQFSFEQYRTRVYHCIGVPPPTHSQFSAMVLRHTNCDPACESAREVYYQSFVVLLLHLCYYRFICCICFFRFWHAGTTVCVCVVLAEGEQRNKSVNRWRNHANKQN